MGWVTSFEVHQVKFEKSEARKIKHNALLWLRLKQRCAFIATEVGSYNADCLGVNEKRMIEVEVKTNFNDLKEEFRTKRYKHMRYFKTEDAYADIASGDAWVPNKFYFALPSALVADCINLLDQKGYTSYGIIDSDEWKVVRRAKDLHDREPNTNVKFKCALRMGSELIRFHEAML